MQYIFYFLNKFTNQRIGIPTTITTIATIKKTKSAIVITTKPKNRLYSLTLITLSIEAFKSREFMSLFRFIFQHLIYFPTPLAPLRLPSVCLSKAEAFCSGNWTRTSDLRVMSPTSYLLLYPAIFWVQKYKLFLI